MRQEIYRFFKKEHLIKILNPNGIKGKFYFTKYPNIMVFCFSVYYILFNLTHLKLNKD